MSAYDPNNIFAKILRNEIPSTKIFENEYALAFHDLYPKAAIHVLVIPKGAYSCFSDFAARASEAEISGFFRAVAEVAKQLGVDEKGYRIISNNGDQAGQEVAHLHVHILGGEKLGPIG